MNGIAIQRALEELKEEKAEAQIIIIECFYAHQTKYGKILKTKGKDKRIPKRFEEAIRLKSWAEEIDRKYHALIQENMWTYVRRMPNTKPIPYLTVILNKDTFGSESGVIFKA